MELWLSCEDSADGIFSGVYEAYLRKADHAYTHLCVGEPAEPLLFATYEPVIANPVYADKVGRTIVREMGNDIYRAICEAMTTNDFLKADAIYHTIVLGITQKLGNRTMDYLTDTSVRKVSQLSTYVRREYLHLQGFLRFEELQNGVLFATIGPKNNIITMLAPHFSNRYRNENFIIYDEIRNLFVLHRIGDGEDDWVVLTGAQIDVNSEYFTRLSAREKEYQACFCHFCEHIGIRSRENPRLQQAMLPLRFRVYMTEFQK